MSKAKKTPVYTSKTKETEKYSQGRSSFTRFMALFLAALMLLGALVSTIFYFIGAQQIAHPLQGGADIAGITETIGDTVC